MSLISFPISPENIKEKVFYEAPVQAYNPTGFTGSKAEYTYTVPSDRKSLLVPSFSVTIGQYSTSSPFNPVGVAASVSFVDFLKPGDVVYSGVRAYTQNNSPFYHNYEFFYIVNSVTVYQKLVTNISNSGAYGYRSINHTISSMQLDK